MKLWLLTLLIALIGWEYAPAMRGGFVYEDAHLTNACIVPGWWTTMARPLTLGSWCAQLGQPTWVFHAVSLSLHLVAVGLVLGVVWSFTGQALPTGLAAAFFGVNALGVEAVAYLSGRSELIAAVGVLGACLAALRGRWVYVGPLLLLGWWGKESAAVGFLLVPLCLWYQRGGAWAWVAALWATALGASIWMRTETWRVGADMGAWALLQATAVARLIVLSVVPIGQTIDYDYARVPMVLRGLAVAALVALAVWAWRSGSRLRVLGVAWMLCAAAPRLLVYTPWSPLSEHQFYLPLVGVAIVLASLLTQETHGHFRPAL